MLRFDQRLVQIFLEARKQALEHRNVDGISAIDVFIELVEESDSLLYSYLSEFNDEKEISEQLLKLNENFAKEQDVKYTIPLEFSITEFGSNKQDSWETKITPQLYVYILAATELAKSINKQELAPEDILMVIIQVPIKPITKFLRLLDINILEFKEEFEDYYYYINEEADEIKETFGSEVSKDVGKYLSVVSGDDAILGRDKEVEALWNILLKKTKRNAILVGDPGVGKTAVVKKMVSQIKAGTAPEEFKNHTIYALDVTAMIGGTKYRGEAEERFIELVSFIKKNKDIILFIDEAHLILGAGSCEGNSMDLANALKPLLASDDSQVIAATTTIEYEKYFSKDPAMRRRFEEVKVEEPTIYEVYPMIKAKVDELSEFHNVKINRRMVDFIALYASCFSVETKNPDRTLDLIDRSMVVTKRKKKRKVDTESVLSNFKVNMELFNSIPEKDKRATSYHEAGHYIAFSYLPFLQKTEKPVVVSIYPADNYIGVTITEKRKNVIETGDKQAYLEKIAALLAGGIAESLVNSEANDGVSSDSKHATQMAKSLVTQTGFYQNFFYSLDTLKTEKSIEADIDEIKKILDDAKQIAKNIIFEHRRELDAVADALMQKHVVSDEELKKVMEKATKSEESKELVLT